MNVSRCSFYYDKLALYVESVLLYIPLQEILRRDWMFKLVGKETFNVGSSCTKATINIDAVSGFAYEYTLEINGKSLKKYMENRSKVTSTWVLNLDGIDCRVVLEKDTMDIWCNGQKLETAVSTKSATCTFKKKTKNKKQPLYKYNLKFQPFHGIHYSKSEVICYFYSRMSKHL